MRKNLGYICINYVYVWSLSEDFFVIFHAKNVTTMPVIATCCTVDASTKKLADSSIQYRSHKGGRNRKFMAYLLAKENVREEHFI
jgi:hypothetical protein